MENLFKMKLIRTKYRSSEPEIMDSFELQGENLKEILKDLERVNQLLGGNKTTIRGIEKLISDNKDFVHIADIGCGSGAMLREIAKWGRKNKLNLKLTGIDANPNTVQIAQEFSKGFPEITFKTQNVFSAEFQKNTYDIICCCLTMHHFKDEEIKSLLTRMKNQTKNGIVINDLHRSKRAYYLFRLFCVFFVKSKIAKNDGLVSILRGFKRAELKALAEQLELENHQIDWYWAFRYQFVIPA